MANKLLFPEKNKKIKNIQTQHGGKKARLTICTLAKLPNPPGTPRFSSAARLLPGMLFVPRRPRAAWFAADRPEIEDKPLNKKARSPPAAPHKNVVGQIRRRRRFQPLRLAAFTHKVSPHPLVLISLCSIGHPKENLVRKEKFLQASTGLNNARGSSFSGQRCAKPPTSA